ncbi:MAG: hypothetical protein ACLTER_20145 [Ruminococcus sp.]
MKFFIKDTVRQESDNEDADGWNKWGWIDTSSITVTDPGKKISKDNVKYGQNVEGGKLCNYLFFLSKDSSGSDVETNKTYSEIEGIGEARDIILEYETFNKYQNATGDVAYKPGVFSKKYGIWKWLGSLCRWICSGKIAGCKGKCKFLFYRIWCRR